MNDRFSQRLLLRFCVLTVAMCTGEIGAGQTLQLFGKWKLNVSQSTLGGPPPISQTVTFWPAGPDVMTGTEETIYADGTRTTIAYTAKADGRDYPISGSAEILARVDTISMSRVDALTIEWNYKKGGMVVLQLPGSLATDGRTLTMRGAGNRVLIYEKQ